MKRLFRTIDERIEESLDSSEGNHITLSHSIPFKNVIDDAVTLIIGVLIVILIWWLVGSIYNTFFHIRCSSRCLTRSLAIYCP